MKTIKAPIFFKNIIVWRHAEAELAEDWSQNEDMARLLTGKGKHQAEDMARWLNQRLPKSLVLLSSPAVRAFQTAQALEYKINVHEALKPGATLLEILDVLSGIKPSKQNLIIVGHQPWLGQLVAHLTDFTGAELNIKKGAIWWLRQSSVDSASDNTHYDVIAVQAPSLLS